MKNIITILITFLCLGAVAQPPQRFFTTFGGNGIDIGYSAKQTLDRQYIITGSTSSYGAGNTDVYLVKLDSMGQILWQKTFGGFANDVGKSVIQVPDSGYIVAGFTSSFGAGGYDAYILRTDKAGTLIWQKTFGGTDWDFANDLIYSPDGDIMVVGNTSSFGNGKKDGFVIKYDFLGNLVFQKYFGGIEDDELRSIIRTNDLNIATVGYTKSKGDINGDCYFLKLNLNGDTLFTRKDGGPYNDYWSDLVQMNNGNYILVGAKTFTANTPTHSYKREYNSNGVFLVDAENYNSSSDENWVSIIDSYAGANFFVTIRTVPVPALNIEGNIFLHKNDFTYPALVNSFCGSEDEYVYSVDKTKDGGYVCVGYSNSFGSLNGDVFLIKQDSTIITYSNVVSIKENKNLDLNSILKNLNNNYYEIEMSTSNSFNIKLVDIFGKIIMERKIEDNKTTLSLNELNSGLYILNVSTNNTNTKSYKLIKN